MDHDEWIAERIAELNDAERGELWRICEVRRQHEGRGGGQGVVEYVPGVPDQIAEVLQAKGLAHRLGALTAASHLVYYYYLRNGVPAAVGYSTYTDALNARFARDESSEKTTA